MRASLFILIFRASAVLADPASTLSVRTLGPELWVSEVETEIEMGPKFRAAPNRWLNEELADSLRASAVSALDKKIFEHEAAPGRRRPVVVSLRLNDRDFTISSDRHGSIEGSMSLLVEAQLYLLYPDRSAIGPLPILFAAFRHVPEPYFGDGNLVSLGVDPNAPHLIGNPAELSRRLLLEMSAGNESCSQKLGVGPRSESRR